MAHHRLLKHLTIPRLLQSGARHQARYASSLAGLQFKISSSETLSVNEVTLNYTYHGDTKKLPLQFLRRMAPEYFDAGTQQRNDVPIDTRTGQRTGPIKAWKASHRISEAEFHQNTLKVTWSDQQQTVYPLDMLKGLFGIRERQPKRVLWGRELDLRQTVSVPFEKIVDVKRDPSGMNDALRHLFQYGILLVTDTPKDKTSLAAFAAALSGGSVKKYKTQSILPSYLANTAIDSEMYNSITDGPFRNLYGSVWSTNSKHMVEGTSVADSAYTSDALPVHTDMTYYQHTPGLQIFNMITPADEGGESVFVDGFAVVEELRKTNKAAFNILCEVENVYRSLDDSTGWNVQAVGSTIKAKRNSRNEWGDVIMIRHNDLDRVAALPPPSIIENESPLKIQEFYSRLDEAHDALDKLLSREDFRLVIKLKQGEMVAVANQRTLHGRQNFTLGASSERSVSGCYVTQDDLDSRFRCLGWK